MLLLADFYARRTTPHSTPTERVWTPPPWDLGSVCENQLKTDCYSTMTDPPHGGPSLSQNSQSVSWNFSISSPNPAACLLACLVVNGLDKPLPPCVSQACLVFCPPGTPKHERTFHGMVGVN